MIFKPSKVVFQNSSCSVPLRRGLGWSGFQVPHQNGAQMIQTWRSARGNLCRSGCATSWSGWNLGSMSFKVVITWETSTCGLPGLCWCSLKPTQGSHHNLQILKTQDISTESRCITKEPTWPPKVLLLDKIAKQKPAWRHLFWRWTRPLLCLQLKR